MNNFPSLPQDIMGGVNAFKFAPMSYFDDSNPLTFLSGKDWLEGFSLHTESRFSVEKKRTDNGIMHSIKFSGIYPGNSAEMESLMNSMMQERHALYIKDNDGLIYQIPYLKFIADFDTDTPKGVKRWAFTFSGALAFTMTIG